jgi:alanyl-tRNA synthetase
MELCGGTHVRTTGDIGSFRILSEGAIAAGIRRIEAIAGNAVGEWARAEATRQGERFQALARKKSGLTALPAFETTTAAAMAASIDARAAHLEKMEAEIHAWEKEKAKAAGADLQKRAAAVGEQLLEAHRDQSFIASEIPEGDGALLRAVADVVRPRFRGPIFLAGATNGQVHLLATVPKELTAKFQAGTLMEKIAPIVGGKGGGRPDNARGAGKDPGKISAALARARVLLTAE